MPRISLARTGGDGHRLSGMGRSGGLRTADEVKTDDRLRFSQMTAQIRIRRKRLIPRSRFSTFATRFSTCRASRESIARASAVGRDGGRACHRHCRDRRPHQSRGRPDADHRRQGRPEEGYAPTGELLQAEQRWARTVICPAPALHDVETRLALAEYPPFWHVEQIPQKTAVLFVIAEKDARVNNTNNAIAASKLLKGPTDVARAPGPFTHAQLEAARPSRRRPTRLPSGFGSIVTDCAPRSLNK